MNLVSPQDFLKRFKTPHSVISVAKGYDQDFSTTEELLQIVQKDYAFPDDEEQRVIKEGTLNFLKSIVLNWLKDIAKIEEDEVIYPGAGVHVFGSYRIGVNKADGDIDVVCLVPMYVTREDNFFGDLARKLKGHREVSDLQLISETLVPLIKVKIQGVLFDILMANVPNQILKNPSLLKQHKYTALLDQKSIRSLNGLLVSEYLLRQFSKNMEAFKTTLMCVKLWAKNRQIYSQQMGYLGGMATTILVGKILQLYPNYPPNKLLDRFFFIYSRWEWKELPVLLQDLQVQQQRQGQSQITLITPVHPCSNAGFNITKSTMSALRKQLRRGSKILAKSKFDKSQLNRLFKPLHIFKQFKNFLEVTVLAKSRNEFLEWKGIVESRLRKLLKSLEQCEKSQYLRLRLYPSNFQRKSQLFKEATSYYIGMEVMPEIKEETIEIIKEVHSFVEHVESLLPGSKMGQQQSLKVRVIPRFRLHPELFAGEELPIYLQTVQQ